MMTDPVGIISLLVCAWLTTEALMQFLPLIRALRAANRAARPEIPDASLPEARVFLCLRGTDPFLDRCLHGLATQNYPRYKVIIIVDSSEDEALPQVMDLQQKYGPDRIEVIFRKYLFPTCSRRASSFVSGMEQLEETVDAIVLCDGDTVPHANWLRELMRPLVQQGSKATSGNRWYIPEVPTIGSLVRYIWNAMAAPCMYQEGIIWAGSMAIHRDVFRDPQFLKAIRLAFSEDTKVAGFLRDQGHRAVPQPDIPVINSETVTLTAFWGFLVRQMLAAKLHHPSWRLVFRTAMLQGCEIWILLPLSIYRGSSALVPWLIGILIYGTITQVCVGCCEWQIRRFVKTTRHQTVSPYNWRRIMMQVPAFAILGLIYPIVVLTAAFAQTHVWRGVTYRILRDRVQLIEPSLEGTYSKNAPTTP